MKFIEILDISFGLWKVHGRVHALECIIVFATAARSGPGEFLFFISCNAVLCADGNNAWRRAALGAQIDFYQVKHVLLELAKEVRRQNGRKITVGTQTLDKYYECWDH